jgi:uncharacterized membrane protein
MTEKRLIITIYSLTFLGVIAWIGAVFLAPYLKDTSNLGSRLIYSVFSTICHQVPSRCFNIFGHPLAVCTRCLGIYFGFFAGTILFPFIKGFRRGSVPPSWLLILVTLPVAVDTSGNFLSLWSSSDWWRFGFGFLWGTILPFYFLVGLSDFFLHLQRKKKRV